MSATTSPGSQTERSFTPREFRDAMGQFATGVVTVTTIVDGAPHAMTANAFMSGSLEPPLVIVSIACTAKMHERIGNAGWFGVSVLADNQQWCSNHFAGKPSPDRQPAFQSLAGVPVVEGANVQVAAQLRHAYPCGDHTLFVGEVQALGHAPEAAAPLLFHGGRYAALSAAAS
ncbi:MAG: flavin reductase family protein [Betaproteobacteria bacterium]|nr:flavin reductase family protein [Betaproteobacteria bacterium]